jgi:hypothetical protein
MAGGREVSGWLVWFVVIGVFVVVVGLAIAALLLLAGTLVVSSRESAAERDRGIDA